MAADRCVRPSLVTLCLVALALLGAGCGGASSPHPTTSQRPPAPNALSQVSANWRAFFAGATPAAQKIQLLENGQTFASVIDAQASSPLARSSSARVSRVTFSGRTSATVDFSINLGRTPALLNQTGTAVFQDGTWKVSTTTFCAILALEQNHPAGCGA